MQRIMMLGLALAAAFAMVAVGAVSVSATGHEFVASKTGKTKSKSTNAQVFKTGSATLECAKSSGTGEVTELKSATHKETVIYSECVAFGSNVSITAAAYEFSANGSVRLEKTVIITPSGAGCEILIKPQILEKVQYANEAGGKVAAEPTLVKIHSKGTGGLCGGENTEGSFSGKALGELEGGTIKWE
jgi:hypothetical protein